MGQVRVDRASPDERLPARARGEGRGLFALPRGATRRRPEDEGPARHGDAAPRGEAGRSLSARRLVPRGRGSAGVTKVKAGRVWAQAASGGRRQSGGDQPRRIAATRRLGDDADAGHASMPTRKRSTRETKRATSAPRSGTPGAIREREIPTCKQSLQVGCECRSCYAATNHHYATSCCPHGLSHGATCVCGGATVYFPARERAEAALHVLEKI
jgi:hypothetical protein